MSDFRRITFENIPYSLFAESIMVFSLITMPLTLFSTDNDSLIRSSSSLAAASLLSRSGQIPESFSSAQTSSSLASLLLPHQVTPSSTTSSLIGFNSNFSVLNNLSLQGSLWASNPTGGGGVNQSRNPLRTSSSSPSGLSLQDTAGPSALDIMMMESTRKGGNDPSSSLLSGNKPTPNSSWNAFSLLPFLQGAAAAVASGSTSSHHQSSSCSTSSLLSSSSFNDSPLNAWSAAMAAYASFLPHVTPLPVTSTREKASSRGELIKGTN